VPQIAFLWRWSFLRASAMLKHVIAIGWTSGRPSVCPSVTRWYCIKTAERIVMLSSPHDSPFILVLCVSRSSQNSDGVTPCLATKQRWVWKCHNFRPITCYISEKVEGRWVYASSLQPCDIYRDCPFEPVLRKDIRFSQSLGISYVYISF